MSDALSSVQLKQIDEVLAKVVADARSELLEPEVYEILQALDIQVPTYLFFHRPDELQGGMLAEFGTNDLILKIVSRDIPHKSKLGGVIKVSRDRERIRSAMKQMEKEILSLPQFIENPPKIDGFLLTSFIEYSKELGNEILVGVKENLAFGPVVSFSKGGSDAEHFAKHFSPPNLRLLPLRREECFDLLRETKIAHKYEEEDHEQFVAMASDVVHRFSQLISHYSRLNPDVPPYIFSEFEVNPLVFDENNQLIAVDGLAAIYPSSEGIDFLEKPNPEGLHSFFWPKGIAVVGISTSDTSKTGNNIAMLLHKLGRKDLFLVNPRGGELELEGQSYPVYKDLVSIEESVELVVVCVPAAIASAVVEDAKAKGAKALVVIPGGFSEVDDSGALESSILEAVEGTGIRLLGPNCLGLFRGVTKDRPGINTLFVPEEKLSFVPKTESNVAILTQSGALGITELDKLKDAIYPRVVVSYGNQIDVDPADLIAYFDRDPEIDVFACYIEGFKPSGGRKFFDAVKECSKPVIVYKAGRTDAGSRAAASHTAAMTGDYGVALAAMEQAGSIVVETIPNHKDLIKAFSLMREKEVYGRRVAGVVNAGFESTYAADNIGGLSLAEFAPETVAKLEGSLPPFVTINPFMDLTPMADDAIFEQCIEVLLDDPGVDSLFISIVPHTVMLNTNQAEMERDKENIAYRIIRQGRKTRKPIVVSVNAGTMYNIFIKTLEEGGIPTFTTAEHAMFALNGLTEYRLSR